jgi:hypothetical protein
MCSLLFYPDSISFGDMIMKIVKIPFRPSYCNPTNPDSVHWFTPNRSKNFAKSIIFYACFNYEHGFYPYKFLKYICPIAFPHIKKGSTIVDFPS